MGGYPKMCELRRKRLQKIAETNSSCEDCGVAHPHIHTHHLDKSKDNHDINNLRLLCPACHGKYHKKITTKQVSMLINLHDSTCETIRLMAFNQHKSIVAIVRELLQNGLNKQERE